MPFRVDQRNSHTTFYFYLQYPEAHTLQITSAKIVPDDVVLGYVRRESDEPLNIGWKLGNRLRREKELLDNIKHYHVNCATRARLLWLDGLPELLHLLHYKVSHSTASVEGWFAGSSSCFVAAMFWSFNSRKWTPR